MTESHLAVLRGLGVADSLARMIGIGFARVSVDRSGQHYEPVDDGCEAFVLAVRIGSDPSTPEDVHHDLVTTLGEAIDLIALSARRPGRWALRHGVAGWLGAVPPQCVAPEPVRVRRSPLAWLRASGTGLVVLGTDRLDTYRTLSLLRAIEVDDREHARELQRI